MRTSLEYSVSKRKDYDYDTDKMVTRIKSRQYAFFVTGCKSKEEHDEITGSFYEFLKENKVESNGFGHGSWEETELYGQKDFSYLDIPVKDMEDKEYIKYLYKEWKLNQRAKDKIQQK